MPGSVLNRYVLIILISGVSLGLLGPLETIERFSFWARIGFWITSCAIGWLQSMIIARGLKSLLIKQNIKYWQLVIITAVILTFPLSFEIRWMWQLLVRDPSGEGVYWITYFITLLINLNFCTLQFALIEKWPLLDIIGTEDNYPIDVRPNEENQTEATVSMLKRKPEGISGPIIAIKTEDHYLRVYTEHGNNLVLSRMSDACADLNHTTGIQVHRSWWVSISSILSFKSTSRQGELRLENDLTVPVSRTNVKIVANLLNDLDKN